MYDIVTVGSAVLDVILKSSSLKVMKSDKFSGGVAMCEDYGGKIEADEIVIVSGGGGTNNAVSFSRKGLKTAVISEIGDDVAGKMICSELVGEGVDTKYLVVEEGEETGVSVILVASEGGRSIVTYRGASRRLTHKDIPWKKLKTRWLHISSLGGRMSLVEELVSWARKNSVKVSINPGKQEILQRERLWKCIAGVDVLFLNQEEASQLSGTNFSDIKTFRSKSCLQGPGISVITAGKHGGKVCVEGKCLFYGGSDMTKVSSLGAGDAFGSGFVTGIIYGKKIEEAVDWGRKNAESVLKYLSAKQGLLNLSGLGFKR